MTAQSNLPSRTSTGVKGLDDVLHGGLLRAGFYLLQGDPGSGKTTLALQFVQARLQAGERSLYVSLTESRADLESACLSHGWSLEGLELRDLTRSGADLEAQSQVSVFHPADTELSDLIKAVKEEVERVQPQHIVFDGMSELRLLAGEPLRYRRTLLSLKELFAGQGITALLLDDRSGAFGSSQPESLVGGNIVLERFTPTYGRTRRRLLVTKVRGSDFVEGYHDYDIVVGGLVVYPRLMAKEHGGAFTAEVLSSGVKNLDIMLHGGLAAGSTTLLLGPAGVGKSTAAMQFVISALKRQQKAAVYVFDEVRHTLVDRAEKLCLGTPGGIEGFVSEGLLHIQQVDAAEKSPGAFAHEVRRAVAEGARVVVIDSLNGYLNSMPEERFLTTHLHELFAFLNHSGVLTIIVVAQHGMMAASSRDGSIDVSYLADSVLLFRYYEANGEVNQAISVFKKRTGPHERSICRLVIDESGFSVGEPLRQFRGIMTGVPQYRDVDMGGAEASPPAVRGPS
ncbi:MAG TPA: ATPase domain-containing protein [Polyangiaceae bacterium]|nr:ATPase domain-containing protein [Polyangiaceae bacterium]